MEIFGVIFLLFGLALLVLPWVNLVTLQTRKREIDELRRDVEHLHREFQRSREKLESRAESEPVKEKETIPEPVKDVVERDRPPELPPKLPERTVTEVAPEVKTPPIPAVASSAARVSKEPAVVKSAAAETKAPALSSPATTTETGPPQDWFSKIAVWVGGVALLVAGFYMIKYSIDSGWLTPAVRLWLTAGFGIVLCAVGFVTSLKSKLSGTERVGQALSGAGVACLYFAVYAAVHLYGFLEPSHGFSAMVAVTVLAVALSLRCGAPVALMGLLGGFLTPLLMSTGSADTVMLFGYLFLLFCGAQFLCVQRGWWGLLLLSLVSAYLWSAGIILWNLGGGIDNLEGAMFFVIGICLINGVWAFVAADRELGVVARGLLIGVRFLVWGGGLVQSLLLVWMGGFAAVDMALFSVLSVGALILSVLKEKEFAWASWLALVAVMVGALSNAESSLMSWFVWPAGLMVLFYVVGHWRGLRSEVATHWRCFSGLSVGLIAPVLFVNRAILAAGTVPFEAFWLVASAGFAALLVLASEHLLRRDEGNLKEGSDFQLFAVLLIGFGLWTYLPAAFLAYGIGGLFLASVVYWKLRGLLRLELILGILGVAWAVVMLPLTGEALGYFFREPFINGGAQDRVAIGAWLIGVAVGLFSLRFLKGKLDELVLTAMGWIVGTVGLFAFVACYQYLDQSVMPSDWSSALTEGGLTALFALLAVLFHGVASRWAGGRSAGMIMAVLAAVRIGRLHLLGSGAEGESFFFNALFLQFGIPFFCAAALAWFTVKDSDQGWRHTYQVASMLLGFIWSSFLVQDYFGGADLLSWEASSTELYTYSVVWLILAVIYQAIGLWRNQKIIHFGSLLLLLFTIGKVFFVDASELEGLFRVLSFLGLGVALIGIGFFYNKVVFARGQEAGANG